MTGVSWTRVVDPDGPGRPALWHTSGSGPAVVLVHGLEDTWDGWTPLVTALCGAFRVYALDLPWHAGSDHRWCHGGTPAQWLRRGLDLVPEPVSALVGHSFGANAVLQMLAGPGSPPVGLHAAALIAPFFRPPTLEVTWDLHRRALEGVRRIMGQGLALRMGERAGRLDPEVFDAMAGLVVERMGPIGFGAFFQHFVATTDLDLSGVDLPTVVLAGVHDESLAGERAVALAAAMPAATVRKRPHYSHFCHVEQAGDVAAELDLFLAEHLPRHLSGAHNGSEHRP